MLMKQGPYSTSRDPEMSQDILGLISNCLSNPPHKLTCVYIQRRWFSPSFSFLDQNCAGSGVGVKNSTCNGIPIPCLYFQHCLHRIKQRLPASSGRGRERGVFITCATACQQEVSAESQCQITDPNCHKHVPGGLSKKKCACMKKRGREHFCMHSYNPTQPAFCHKSCQRSLSGLTCTHFIPEIISHTFSNQILLAKWEKFFFLRRKCHQQLMQADSRNKIKHERTGYSFAHSQMQKNSSR